MRAQCKLQEVLLITLILFLSMFTFQYKEIKLLMILSLIILNISKIKYEKFYFFWFSIFLLYNVFFLLEGELYNKGVLKYYLGTSFFNIVLYMTIFNFKIHKIEILKKLEKIYFGILYAMGLLFFIYYIHYNYNNQILSIPISIINKIIYVREILRPGQYTKVSVYTHNIVFLNFLISYIVSVGYLKLNEKRGFLKYILYNFLAVLLIFFTLRKVLILVLVISHMLFLFFNKYYNIRLKIKKRVVLAIIIFVIALILIIVSKKNIDIVNYITKSFDYTKSNLDFAGVKERVLQATSLLKDFLKRPLLGHGIGANASYVRSIEPPGAYELTYLAMLFQRGIIGVLIYWSMIASIFFKYRKISKKKYIDEKLKGYMLSYSMGLIGILLTNGTNPALDSFEYSWMIYINIFIISNLKNIIQNKNIN